MRIIVLPVLLLAITSFAAAPDAVSAQKIVYASATTKDGRPAALTSEQCRVAPGIKITGLEALNVTPMSYIVALDMSNSGRFQFAADVKIAKLILSSVVRPKIDQGLLVAFDTRTQVSEVTRDPVDLSRTLDSYQAGGGSAIFDSIAIATRTLAVQTPESQPRVMFLITDGEDNFSRVTFSETVATLLRAGVRVYPIWTSSVPAEMSKGGKVLASIANYTGGILLEPKRNGKFLNMEKPIQTIRGDLSSWIRVELALPVGEKNGSLARLNLRCGEKSLVFRSPSSYIAGPQSAMTDRK